MEAKYLTIKERNYAFKAYISILVYLLYLKKILKKIYLKKYYFIKQGLYKLKANKKNLINKRRKQLSVPQGWNF